jgi:NADPH-dependent 2,4-dienoyl-CoA reductase/sulfur reductase-like enzyme
LKDILVIRREKKVMVPCGIPYIYGTLGAVEKNVMPDKLLGEAKLKLDEAVSLDREAKSVVLESGEGIGYEKLVLATGSNPITPQIPGIERKSVYLVRKDPDYLHTLGEAMNKASHIVVIGGGFIGVEFADECRKRGLDVTIVELLEHCLQLVCPEELCIRAEEVLNERGINLITGNAVKSIGGNEKMEIVELDSGDQIKCDMVIIGIGVSPNTKLATEGGLEIGPTRGIQVDEFQRTNDPDVFAVGDCAEKYSFFSGEPVPVRLASVATREGKIAAANLFSARWRNVGTVGAFSTMIGDTAIAMAGLTDAQATKMGYNVVIGEAEAVSKHPGTMPDAKPMKVRLTFDRRSGKLLGGCACCTPAVGEVGNLISACTVNGMTMEQVAPFPMGTHPWLTASPLAYQLTDAASDALHKVN